MPKKWHLKEDDCVFIFCGNEHLKNPNNPDQRLGYVLDMLKPVKKKSFDGATVSSIYQPPIIAS